MYSLNRDEILLLAMQMDLPELLNFCSTNKYINEKVCKDEKFWTRKLKKLGFDLSINPLEEYRNYNIQYKFYNITPSIIYKSFMKVTVNPSDIFILYGNYNDFYFSHKRNEAIVYKSYHPESLTENKEFDRIHKQLFFIDGESFLLPILRFKNVERVLFGIPQTKEENFTWSTHKDVLNIYRDLPQFYGSSILLDMGELNYIFVGWDQIIKFTAPEEITELYSFMGNNTATYPIAISKNYIYDFTYISQNKYYPKGLFDIDWNDKTADNIVRQCMHKLQLSKNIKNKAKFLDNIEFILKI